MLLVAALALYFCVAVTLLGLRYFVLPHVDSFRPRIEALVSQRLHAQLTIGQLAAQWRGLEPGVEITNLQIHDQNGQLTLNVPHASAALSWSSLLRLTPVLSSLVVDTPDVRVERHADGSLAVAGIAVPTASSGDATFASWLLAQGEIDLNRGTLRWHDATRNAPELVLSGLQARMLNRGLLHQVALRAPANGTLSNGPLDFRARFLHKPFETIGRPAHWKGTAWISTGTVNLPVLARYINIHLDANAGTIANQAWIDFSGGHIHGARGQLRAQGVQLRTENQPSLDIPAIHTTWQLALTAHSNYQLHLTDFHAELGQPPLADGTPVLRTLTLSSLTAQYRLPDVDHGQLLSVAGDRVDLGLLNTFLRGLPMPATFLSELNRYDPHGILDNYIIEAERAKPANAAAVAAERLEGSAPLIHYHLAGDLHGLSIAAQAPAPGLTALGHPHVGLPGVENLWGHIDADETHGSLTLDTVGAAVTIEGLFDQPRIPLDRLRAQAHWTLTQNSAGRPPGIDLTVSQLHIENHDAELDTTLHLTEPGDGHGTIDLNSKLVRGLVASVPRYLPDSIHEDVRGYLAHALQGGQITPGATIVARGPLDGFPYTRDPSEGVFEIHAPFTGARFEPTPTPPLHLADGSPALWPALDNVDGVFSIKQKLLHFDISHASYANTTIGPVTGEIADLGHSGTVPLVIHGIAKGPLADLLDYAQKSPIGQDGKTNFGVQADGPANLDLTLSFVPHQPVAVAGKLGFFDDTITRDGLPPLSALRGTIQFTRDSLAIDQLDGQMLGGDIRARGALTTTGFYAFNIDGHLAPGATNAAQQKNALGTLLAHTSGSAPYTINVKGSRGAGLNLLNLRSDLDGLALNLPAPFNKPAGTPMPFDLSVSPAHIVSAASQNNVVTDLATLRLGPLAASYLMAVGPNGGPHALRGALAIHDGSVPSLPAQGVQASIDLPALDLDAWRGFMSGLNLSNGTAAQAGATPGPFVTGGFLPTRVNAAIDTLTLGGRPWHQVHIDANHGSALWQAHLDAQEANGTLSWAPGGTQGAGVLTARLARLDIPASASTSAATASAPPAASAASADTSNGAANQSQHQTFPALDIAADQLSVAGRQLGRIEVRAHNTVAGNTPVWQLDRLQLSNPDATLSATGNWRTPDTDTPDASAAPRRTALDFTLDIKDAGKLLDRIGLPRTVANGHGSWTGQIGWHGGPSSPDPATLNGQTTLTLHDGGILKVDPGAAKLLGVLSLQSLVHYLSFDFRNLTASGLPFRAIEAGGHIDAGVFKLDHFSLDSTPATVTMTGAVDLGQQTQDLQAHIVPHLGAGTAALATAVINPLLGLGVLAADVALSQTFAHLFKQDYDITGSWAHPVIKRVGGDQSKMNPPSPVRNAALR